MHTKCYVLVKHYHELNILDAARAKVGCNFQAAVIADQAYSCIFRYSDLATHVSPKSRILLCKENSGHVFRGLNSYMQV